MATLAELTAAYEATVGAYRAAREVHDRGLNDAKEFAELAERRWVLREAVLRMEEARDDIRAYHHPFEGRVSLRELHLAESNRQNKEAYNVLWSRWNAQGEEFDVGGWRVD